MGQAAVIDFAYEMAADSAGMKLALSVFSDRAQFRDELHEDAGIAGFAVRDCGALADLLDGEAAPLGELAFLDCPELDGAGYAALSRLDERVARAGARLIVATTVDTLDAVYGCCSASDPQILVNPRRTDRVIALGRMLAELSGRRVRELSEEDRRNLLRITEQVTHIAERIDLLTPDHAAKPSAGSAFRFAPRDCSRPCHGERMARATRPPLPDPRLVRGIIQQRQLRARFFDGDLFADPAWDMLLDLTAARAEHVRVSVTSLCIASGVPPTTALRWISQMTEAGLLERIEDETDRRRAFIQLTEKSSDAMARYFHELGQAAAQMV
ncbi:MarR family transcriptional regulator [Aurantiacibacter xanthus]|uniref:MarR family transcriptional regulator n=1 Tax=Aurantiacibacter xanthus TaxID=1784712 RepID=A0A3A1P4W0_9SPHN|nr:winged helix DNA-binding protein [Aurantiacibacter xanthus]RIV85267.1 MarR family transcriptional regulator [Aurantiacibacter xanthus]